MSQDAHSDSKAQDHHAAVSLSIMAAAVSHKNQTHRVAQLAFQHCPTETFAVINCCLFSCVPGTNR